MERALRVVVVNDYELVIAGIAAFLGDERVDVVELAASLPVVSDVDIVLYDRSARFRATASTERIWSVTAAPRW